MKDLLSFKKKNYFILRIRSFKYIIIIVAIFLFEIIDFSTSEIYIEPNSHYIFTFWEPRNSLPEYINLCIKTWKKYLPNDYKIIVLDYNNLRYFLDYKLINKILCKRMSLQVQSDAIRVAVLQKYGGIWMDSDTIITNSKCMNMLFGSDLIMFGSSKKKIIHIGFIYASKNSTILKAWLKGIIKRNKIFKQRLFLKNIFPIKKNIESFNELITWNYLGNGILNELVKNVSEKSFKIIERDDAYVLPEMYLQKDHFNNYQDFYFTANDPEPLLKKCKGILMLHNSWTEEKYQKMSKKEFLFQDIMLVRLLKRLLSNYTKLMDIK